MIPAWKTWMPLAGIGLFALLPREAAALILLLMNVAECGLDVRR